MIQKVTPILSLVALVLTIIVSYQIIKGNKASKPCGCKKNKPAPIE